MKNRLLPEHTQAILIDVQERLTPLIADYETVVANCVRLIEGLQLLDVPLIANEQYPKGLGHTIPKIKEVLKDTQIFEKVTFSACDDESTMTAIEGNHRPVVLIFGIETAIDLLDRGFTPVLVVDAVGSRTFENKQIAIDRMRKAGVVMASVEMVLFELCRSAKNPVFKGISALVK